MVTTHVGELPASEWLKSPSCALTAWDSSLCLRQTAHEALVFPCHPRQFGETSVNHKAE